MTFDTHDAKPVGSHAVTASIALLARLGTGAKAAAHRVFVAMQLARMMSVLANMSDEHLELIGVARSEIPDYAAKLLAGE